MSVPLRVLVVDDSATVRGAVQAALAEDAVEVHEAEDGEVALLRAHLVDPQVILMDVQMPRMDGLSALRALQAAPGLRDIPVVMLTQLDGADDIAEALQAGAHDYLRKPFRDVELRARVAAAGRVGRLVTELRHVNAQLERASRTDHLTGLPNRRELDRQLRRPDRAGLAVAVIDIDHFKAVNDTHGHDAGDGVLRIVADRLASVLRDGDVVGRWGGEEFVVVLAGTDGPGAATACERMLDAIRQPLPAGAGPQRVTVSIGLAVRSTAEEPVDALIQQADAALYRAKAAGRDRLATADGGPPID